MVEPGWLLEAGAGTGFMNCRTDLGGRNGQGMMAVDWQSTKPSISLLAIATYRHAIGFRVQFLRGNIGAADSIIGSGLAGSRYERNLHFQSPVTEMVVLIEFYPFSLINGNISSGPLQPFVTAGAGWYRFNPRAIVNDHWIDLQPLHTEGQGFKNPGKEPQPSYDLNDLNIPFGFGCRWEAGPFLHFRLEFLHRILFTDYLDDVSTQYTNPIIFYQFLSPAMAPIAEKAADRRKSRPTFREGEIRGNPDKNDAYFQLQFAITVLLNRKKGH